MRIHIYTVTILLILAAALGCKGQDGESSAQAALRSELETLEERLYNELGQFETELNTAFADNTNVFPSIETAWTEIELINPLDTHRESAFATLDSNHIMIRANFSALRAAAVNRGFLAEYDALQPAAVEVRIADIFRDMRRVLTLYMEQQ